ncbi:INO80 complex subunit D-like isoform X2 [Conger conger]|uniref:INO80 complex subunit D-like isoform X2 n=1 Tax=Conger conger TaxID=82655 RepID=UPI002A59B745|nr:INO80 complex subunit D-like isoform X2 [Conger conger]
MAIWAHQADCPCILRLTSIQRHSCHETCQLLNADVLKNQIHVMYEGKHIHFSEVDNKPLCSYSPKLCKQRRLNGYAFCIRHVLEDKTAPFRQCEYVAKYNSQRCTNPIPKTEERRYCNSHLQVLGFLPKKERRRKQEVLEEMRARPHLASVALNITVPSLALTAPNGLDRWRRSPPRPPRPTPGPLPGAELLDPFAFHEEETDGEEGGARQPSNRKKLQRQRPPDAVAPKPKAEHFSPLPTPSQCPSSPTAPCRRPPAQPADLHLSQAQHPYLHQQPQPQGLLCKPPPPQTSGLLPPRLPLSTNHSPAQAAGPSLGRKAPPMAPPTASPPPSDCRDGSQRRPVTMRPVAFSPPPACLARLHHLVQLCSQRQQQHGDLFPHLGLDWSEDSAEDEEEERIPPCHYSWRPQERDSQDISDDEADRGRSSRLARLCTYLRQKYKHLCTQERAAMRQRRYRCAFRRALLHAAGRDPDCAGQLVQELHRVSHTPASVRSVQRRTEPGLCTGSTKGQACSSTALPFTQHCFQHILLSRSQQLFSSCTARFADGQQCPVPVFDITHQTPLCDEHAKKMDSFLRGDGVRRVQHQQLQRKPRKKTKPPALTKKHKKKRRALRRPQKPIPPALPQGNLGMPCSLSLPAQAASIRTPLTPSLSNDELPDDITNDISDIPHDLELNQEDFSDVLPRLPDDLQDFDLFEGKNGDLLPTTEEAEELVRALQAMGSYTDTLVCLGVQGGAMGMPAESFSSLELADHLLQPPTPPSSSSSSTLLTQSPPADRPFPRTLPSQLLPKPSPHYAEHIPSPHADSGLLLEAPARSPWGSLSLPLADPSPFGSLSGPEGLLLSTALSTPPSGALPQGGLSTSSPHLLLASLQPKLQLPQFSSAFGLQLAAHSGIPTDLQPSHSSTAPPTGFSLAGASASSVAPPFPTQ